MSKPQFTYFNARGRGEVVRLVFAAAGVDYEDKRIEQEQWPEFKKSTPTGVLPFVQDKGAVLVQSGAIARYYARKNGLMGKFEWEYYLVERAMAQADDVLAELMKVFFAPDDKKAEALKNFQENKGLSLLQTLESFLKDGGSSGLFVPSGLTLADLNVLNVFQSVSAFSDEFVAKFPKLQAHTAKVKQVSPRVAKWLETRPTTKF